MILARSPYLAHLIMSLMPGSTLQLAFTDGNITEEVGFSSSFLPPLSYLFLVSLPLPPLTC